MPNDGNVLENDSGACVNNCVIKTEHNIHNCFPICVLNTLIKNTEYLITIDEY